MEKVFISFMIEKETLKKLDKLAVNTDRTRSSLLRVILKDAVEKVGG